MSTSSVELDRPAVADFEVHIDLDDRTRPCRAAIRMTVLPIQIVALHARSHWRGAIAFEARKPSSSSMATHGYKTLTGSPLSFESALALTRGAFAPPPGQATFGSIGDSAPDTWAAVSCSAPNAVLRSAKAAPFALLQRATTYSALPITPGLAHSDFAGPTKELLRASIRGACPQ